MVVEGTLEAIYALVSVAVSLVGLTMVGFATRAFARTGRRELLYIAIGFSFIVAAMVATTATAFLQNFQGVDVILTVNYAMTTVGFVLVIYGVKR